ncbi:Uncharacterised protein [Klebsiella pneumoniae]|nr:Uncharacterised protein [Klebsiella pneumoniae]
MAGAKDEVADRLAIRRCPGKQMLRRFGVRTKIVADKIGDPLGAGKIQIVFRAKIIGDCGDILPGLGGDIAGGGMLAVLAKLGDSGRDKLTFCLFAFSGHRVPQKLINRLINFRRRLAVCPPARTKYESRLPVAPRRPR